MQRIASGTRSAPNYFIVYLHVCSTLKLMVHKVNGIGTPGSHCEYEIPVLQPVLLGFRPSRVLPRIPWRCGWPTYCCPQPETEDTVFEGQHDSGRKRTEKKVVLFVHQSAPPGPVCETGRLTCAVFKNAPQAVVAARRHVLPLRTYD